ncbi:MAG: hypothetical protein ACRDQZ_04120 [Mycobacteriales bacterium]
MIGPVFREEEVDTGTATSGLRASDFKEGKDSKDFKDGKDSKDWKDSKDGKDSSDFVFVSTGESRQFADQGSDLGTDTVGEAADADDNVVMVLRTSRVNRYLRRAGLVI